MDLPPGARRRVPRFPKRSALFHGVMAGPGGHGFDRGGSGDTSAWRFYGSVCGGAATESGRLGRIRGEDSRSPNSSWGRGHFRRAVEGRKRTQGCGPFAVPTRDPSVTHNERTDDGILAKEKERGGTARKPMALDGRLPAGGADGIRMCSRGLAWENGSPRGDGAPGGDLHTLRTGYRGTN